MMRHLCWHTRRKVRHLHQHHTVLPSLPPPMSLFIYIGGRSKRRQVVEFASMSFSNHRMVALSSVTMYSRKGQWVARREKLRASLVKRHVYFELSSFSIVVTDLLLYQLHSRPKGIQSDNKD